MDGDAELLVDSMSGAADPSSRIEVVFIGGYERSGTTLVHNIVSQTAGFFGAGEISRFWDWGLRGNQDCTCGRSFSQCSVWSSIADGLETGVRGAPHMTKLTAAVANVRLFTSNSPAKRASVEAEFDTFRPQIAALYASIWQRFGGGAIVDSSKTPFYLRLLLGLPSIDVKLIHVVRDPRAVEYSKYRRALSGHEYYSRRHSLIRGALAWNAINHALRDAIEDGTVTGTTIRYEDMAGQPRATLERAFAELGLDFDPAPFVDDHRVVLEPTHVFAGSDSRSAHAGEISLRADNQWENALPRKRRRLIEWLTLRSRRRFGYTASSAARTSPRADPVVDRLEETVTTH